MKLENFSNIFQNFFREVSTGSGVLAENILLGKADVLKRSNSMKNHSEYSNMRNVKFTKKGTINRTQKFKGGSFMSDKTYGKTHKLTPTPALGWSMVVFVAFDIYQGVKRQILLNAMYEDKKAFQRQTQSYGALYDRFTGDEIRKARISFVSQVLNDIRKAREIGILDDSLSTNELSDLANIILFGGNGGESKKIVELGEKIIKEVSDVYARINLIRRKIAIKEYSDSLEENSGSNQTLDEVQQQEETNIKNIN